MGTYLIQVCIFHRVSEIEHYTPLTLFHNTPSPPDLLSLLLCPPRFCLGQSGRGPLSLEDMSVYVQIAGLPYEA